MRYYDITISNPSGGELLHYTTHPNGVNSPPDPGALQVELDLYQLMYGQAAANSLVRVWGIPLSVISSVTDLHRKNIVVRGGMGKGLPLANPSQAGMLVGGQILQCFGNWVNTDMTLDLILQPGLVKDSKNQEPRDLTTNAPANTPMSQSIGQTLKKGYPDLKQDIKISNDLKLPNPEVGFCANLGQYSQYVKNLSRKIKGAQNYCGVEIFIHGDAIYARDGTVEEGVKQLSYLDLVGQPVWILPNTVQVTTVMRGDIAVGSYVNIPPGIITTTSSALSNFSALGSLSTFKGKFWVQKVRHVGNSRQPDGRAWVTVLDCLAMNTSGLDPNDLGPGYGVQTGPGAA